MIIRSPPTAAARQPHTRPTASADPARRDRYTTDFRSVRQTGTLELLCKSAGKRFSAILRSSHRRRRRQTPLLRDGTPFRCKSQTQHVVQVKIMKLVRSHEIFRLLRDLSVLRRQKLRRYRRVQHIRQYRAKLLIPAGIRVVAHQVAHQRLRNGGIDRIHGHVIAVVRRPAECKLQRDRRFR